MTKLTRTFTVAELEAIGVPFECGVLPHFATELDDQLVDTRRWVSVHQLVFRAPDDGKVYAVHYEQGLTENQEDSPPFHGDEVTATAMEQREVTVIRWLPVETTEAPDA